MGRSLIPLSFTFPPEMVDQIDSRAGALNLSRSAYFRQLVREDISRSTSELEGEDVAIHRKLDKMAESIAILQEKVALLESDQTSDLLLPPEKSSKAAEISIEETQRVMSVEDDRELGTK